MTNTEYRETLEYLFGLQMVGIKLGLDNIRLLMEGLGNPHLAYPVVHIAGTNGKGSTAAFLASILTASGYRTGLYTSPHLVDFSERIRIDGAPIPERDVVEFAARIRPVIDANRMTFFEATTAMAFQYFADNACDIAVIETGLGGRLDATNIVMPAVTIITSLGIEHTEFLGDTLEEIAAEKGGIVKEGVPLITAVTQLEALGVLERICSERHAKIERVSGPLLPPVYNDINSMRIELPVFGAIAALDLELIGDYQGQNAALAIRAAELLHEKGQKRIAPVTISAGVRLVRKHAGIAGRMLKTGSDPECILDVAHNPAGVEALMKTYTRLRDPGKTHLVFGFMGAKDHAAVLHILARYAWASVTPVQAAVHGSLDVAVLGEAAKSAGFFPVTAGSVTAGVRSAQASAKAGETVLIFGSHYVAGEYLQETEFISRGS